MSTFTCRRAAGRAALAAVVIGATLVGTGATTPAATVTATATFTPVADARVEQSHPKNNYGNSSMLRVDKGSSSTINSYVQFGVANLSGSVQSAHLRIWVQKNGSDNGSSLSATTSAWGEKTITWNNAPPAGTLLRTTTKLPAKSWVDYDVTGHVTGNGNYAFHLALTSGSDGADISSRQSSSNRPQLVVVTTQTDPPPPPPPPPPPAWRSGNAYGAGYMNFVRFHPTDGNRVLLNTDVGGLHLSKDGASTWLTRGRNVADYIASVAWHPTLGNVAYALAGKGDAGSGGLMVSEDGGDTWRMDSTTPTGHGNNTPSGDGLPRPHPRSTGQLLAVDTVNRFLYAGTYKQGLLRAPLSSSGDPGAWTTVALAPSGSTPYFIRGLALDDQDPTTVYVATYGSSAGAGTGRVYRVSAANTSSATTTELTGSPRNAEEVRSLGGHLYAVANDAGGAGVGAFRLGTARTAAGTTAWRRIAAGPSVTTITYYGMEIYQRGSTTTLWVTSDKAWRPSSDVAYKNMWRGTSTDDFATDGSWAALPDKLTDTPNDMAGPHSTPDPFWAIAESTYGWLGRDSIYTSSAVTVSPTDPNTLVMAGQVGPWRSRDNGATWYPVPTGINILVQTRVTADPDLAGRVYVGSNDYRGFSSTDALRTARHLGVAIRQAGAPNEAGDTWSVAIDTAASGSTKPVYYGMGERDVNTFGQIWMDPDPSTPTTGWTQVLDSSVASGRRPIGLAVVRDPAAPGTPIVLAVIQGGGMYRKVGSGAWAQAAGFTSPIVNGFVYPQVVEFAWRPGWNKVYVYDRSSGLWRSNDFGLTWTKLYSSPDTGTNKQGFVAAHPTNQDIVYLSTSAGLSVIPNAGTAGAGGASLVSLGLPAGKPGPLAVGPDGRIYVATQAEGTGGVSRIYASALTPAGTGVRVPWTDAADDLWRSAVNSSRELTVGPDGTVYAGMSGGVFVLDGGAPVG